HLAIDVGFLNTSPRAQRYWAWGSDINGGWPDQNLIAGGPADCGEALIPS
ncbi:hypothetical protein A2U01_0102163, partial [Trifolium medium]|nr:hypothetical protein [Trifolium medium]